MVPSLVGKSPFIFHYMKNALDEQQNYILSIKEIEINMYFNAPSSGKKTLKTGLVCNSEE